MENNTNAIKIIDGKEYSAIYNYDMMEPFFFTLATSCDLWIYISSNGALTAGRRDANHALFPYMTEDKLHTTVDSGPVTLIKAGSDFWQPFSVSYIKKYKTERNIYKSINGSAVIFEEINNDLKLSFLYKWEYSDKYGFVRTSKLKNISAKTAEIKVVDGVLNLLPYGISSEIWTTQSCLTDGYKYNEIIDGNFASYSMSSGLSDSPEPLEVLKANVVWSDSKDVTAYITEDALSDFCNGTETVRKEMNIGRGCYLLKLSADLSSNEEKSWRMIMDIGVSQGEILKLLAGSHDIESEIKRSEKELMKIIAKTDGLQLTADSAACAHHMSDVTYNDMRGGLFLDGYGFSASDFSEFVKQRNIRVYDRHKELLKDLGESCDIFKLRNTAEETGDVNLLRLCYEYLPLSFSRRHGDPSRPWNTFLISLTDENGNPITGYEGNWRDIFQNWEAMCISFPEYYINTIVKFLNATTADGYNPMKLNREGIEWTEVDSETWGVIGYWSDHQIIYLVRLIEWLKKFNADQIDYLLKTEMYTHANVPYEICDLEAALANPKRTISYNFEKSKKIADNVKKYGSDQKLVMDGNGVLHTSFAEKAAILLLAKMTNLVINGGTWMNTQRPEWNDANNAIVGNGLSVVTVCQIKRYIGVLLDMFKNTKLNSAHISVIAKTWLCDACAVMEKYLSELGGEKISGSTVYNYLKDMWGAYDKYKEKLYKDEKGGVCEVTYDELIHLFELSDKYIAYCIRANRRDDGLYHSYNIMRVNGNEIGVDRLSLMLEGQVAALSSGELSGAEAAELLRVMRGSALYSERDKSYYLYPAKMTKPFMKKNIIGDKWQNKGGAVDKLLRLDGGTVMRDINGALRFGARISTIKDLRQELDEQGELSDAEKAELEECFDDTFKHSSFMGRSQIMYKYEGIGCIYWHQNSKLLISVQENYLAARKCGDPTADELWNSFCEIRAGLGYNKTPKEWGAFPYDAYSHTPFAGGARQPVMTGQVKEDIIVRFGELGVEIENGCAIFDCSRVEPDEYLKDGAKFNYIDSDGCDRSISVPAGGIAFTFCQVPVVYSKTGNNRIIAELCGESQIFGGNALSAELSRELFGRSGRIKSIKVEF